MSFNRPDPQRVVIREARAKEWAATAMRGFHVPPPLAYSIRKLDSDDEPIERPEFLLHGSRWAAPVVDAVEPSMKRLIICIDCGCIYRPSNLKAIRCSPCYGEISGLDIKRAETHERSCHSCQFGQADPVSDTGFTCTRSAALRCKPWLESPALWAPKPTQQAS